MTDPSPSSDAPTSRLIAEIVCPNCWHRFPPERLLFVARHESLLGDEIAGPGAYRRFLPTRFNIDGDALDARGMVCHELACPRCHLILPRPMIEMRPVMCSIAGSPASGKSYFLSAMTWEMRAKAPRLGLVFADGDPTANFELQRYEETMFLSPTPDVPVELPKTQLHGSQLYQTVTLEGQPQTFPRPFQFTVRPTPDRTDVDSGDGCRALVLYDNAGEHFLPGADSTTAPVTLHLAQAQTIFFVFDPTQDPRFRRRCHSDDPQLKLGSRPGTQVSLIRQESVLTEMAARVRRYRGLSHSAQHAAPLIVILAKADIWADLIQLDLNAEPVKPGEPMKLDMPRIDATSKACRKLMQELCPEIVGAAEGFSKQVMYIPVSSLGASPEMAGTPDKPYYGIRPSKIQPKWVTVPVLWALARSVPGLVSVDSPAT